MATGALSVSPETWGGGHSWVGFSLRDESLLIDLGRLDEVSIDERSRLAIVQPATRGREFNRKLAAHGLAFPCR